MSSISVIMPIYNKQNQLLRSINSVLNQTYRDFKLILINDGSTDLSGEIIKNHIEDTRVVYLEQENMGVSFTRNKGIDLANTTYLTFLDADDEYHPTFLEEMIYSIKGANVAYCGFFNKSKNRLRKSKINFVEGNILVSYLNNRCLPNTNCWLIKKNFLDRHNIRFSEEISWGEDMEFFSKILLHENNVKPTKSYLTYYNRGIKGALSEEDINKFENDIEWMEKLKKYIMIHEKSEKRVKKLKEAIDSYRIPASIVYRLNSNLNNYNSKEILSKYKNRLKKIKITNGVRSLKLIYYYLVVKVKLLNWR